MKNLKSLIRILKNVFTWIHHLISPAAKTDAFFDQALRNIEDKKMLSQLEKRQIQGEINFWLNAEKRRRILTENQKLLLIMDKFGKRLKNTGFTICPETFKIIKG